MNLGQWLAESILLEESNIKTVVAIYPGRFQPMGQHHAAVYKKLASKFGQSNTFVVTSNKVPNLLVLLLVLCFIKAYLLQQDR